MKKVKKHFKLRSITTLILALVLLGTANAQPGTPITYQNFYDQLSPYGTWMNYPAYGNVWSPKAEEGFRPYETNGNWSFTNDGWYWNSDYAWGWAGFHYGTWVYDETYGWLWVPGYDWSPAWVTWGSVGDNYCWAPLMPNVNANANFATWRPHGFYWNFCNKNQIFDKDIYKVTIKNDQMRGQIKDINIINNFSTTNYHHLYYSKGPLQDDVQHFTNKPVNIVAIKDINNSGGAKTKNGGQVNVYRPQVQTQQPKEFRNADNPRPVTESYSNFPAGPNMNEQRNNIERLPVQRAVSGGGSSNGQQRSNNAGNRGGKRG